MVDGHLTNRELKSIMSLWGSPGDSTEIAHIDLLLGNKEGPRFGSALQTRFPELPIGHAPFWRLSAPTCHQARYRIIPKVTLKDVGQVEAKKSATVQAGTNLKAIAHLEEGVFVNVGI